MTVQNRRASQWKFTVASQTDSFGSNSLDIARAEFNKTVKPALDAALNTLKESSIYQRVSSLTGLQWAAIITPIVASIAFLSVPYFRWNLVLYLYMPTLSGLYFQWESWLLPAFHAYLEWELRTFPHLFEPTPLVEISADEYTYDEFLRRTDNLRKAAVIRGLFANSTATQTFGQPQWIEKYHEFQVKSVRDIDKSGDKYDYNLYSESFDSFVAGVRNGETKYGYGLDEIYTQYPELIDHLELSRVGRHNGRDFNFCQSIALFIGSTTKKGLRWHNANHANLGLQIHGSKVFHLIDPHYSIFMGPDGNADPYSTGFAHRSPQHIVDRIPTNTVTVNAGDAIFVPVWYWHSVETTGDPETGLSMLGPCRFGSIQGSLRGNYALELYRHLNFINWLHPKVPILARFVPYFRVIQDGIREFLGTMPYWDAPDCYSSKRTACDRYFNSVGWDIEKWKH